MVDTMDFNTSIQSTDGNSITLPVSTASPLFIVGPNGAGKSGLMLSLYQQNLPVSVRISAHRQTWMETNYVPFSPQQKVENAGYIKSQDALSQARWLEWNSSFRNGIILADIIDATNAAAREISTAMRENRENDARVAASKKNPLEIIGDLFAGAGIPITLSITENSSIVASKNEGDPYSIAALSDGERAALLIAGSVLTANEGALILIDEPERHLHIAIVMPLLLQLFNMRPDCAFVISTHELSLPVNSRSARTVLVRSSKVIGDIVSQWEVDVLEPNVEIDDATKEAIIGSRSKILFIEGDQTSRDKPLYEILFPGVSIIPRSTCRDVEYAVKSIRDSRELVWVQAYGIVDQDQLTPEKRDELQEQGIYPLSVYSVEGLYYDMRIVEAIAERQSSVSGIDAGRMYTSAIEGFFIAITEEADNLAARMSEQAVKDAIARQMPDWRKILNGDVISITCDPQSTYQAERDQLERWLQSRDTSLIIARYPIRSSGALRRIANALEFRNVSLYEAAVRKLVVEDSDIKRYLHSYFGNLPDMINN